MFLSTPVLFRSHKHDETFSLIALQHHSVIMIFGGSSRVFLMVFLFICTLMDGHAELQGVPVSRIK